MSNPAAYIVGTSLISAAGGTPGEIYGALADDRREPSPLPLASHWVPPPLGFMVQEPSAAELRVSHRLTRTMEKQALMAVAGALLAVRGTRLCSSPAGTGLFLAAPTVDEEVPSLAALEETHRAGGFEAEQWMRCTYPLAGLTLLNSTACAHISALLRITGSMGVYSHQADAGVQALIEGALAIAEGELDQALVGGVSSKINAFLFLHLEALGVLERSPDLHLGEGSAFLVLAGAPADDGAPAVTLSGFARAFAGGAADVVTSRIDCMDEAVRRAGVAPQEIDCVMADPIGAGAGCGAERQALEAFFGLRQTELPLASVARVCGFLGPADPLLHAALGYEAIRTSKRHLVDVEGRLREVVDGPVRHVLVNSSGFNGQLASVLLSRAPS